MSHKPRRYVTGCWGLWYVPELCRCCAVRLNTGACTGLHGQLPERPTVRQWQWQQQQQQQQQFRAADSG